MIKLAVDFLSRFINAFDVLVSPLNSRLAYNKVEGTLRWLIGYPLLFSQILLFMLIAWGVIGSELGLTDLFWHEAWWIQLLVGYSICWLFGGVILLNYLLHVPQDLPGLQTEAAISISSFLTLLPSRNPGVRRVGRWIAYWLLSLLVITFVGKWIAIAIAGTTAPLPYHGEMFVVGYLGAFLIAYVCSCVDHLLGIREAIASQDWTRRPFDEQNIPIPGAIDGIRTVDIPMPEDAPAPPPAIQPVAAFNLRTLLLLNGMAIFVGVFTLSILTIIVVLAALGMQIPPLVISSSVLILIDLVAGFLAFRIRSPRTIGLLAFLCIYALNLPSSQSPLSFPNIPGYRWTLPKGQKEIEINDVVKDAAKYRAIQPADGKLIEGKSWLDQFHALWDGEKKTKPKLVLFAVSGGGIRAAVWTGLVLEGLEAHPALNEHKFRDHIRMFAGASGGMVGAGAYVGRYEDGLLPQSPRDPNTGLLPFSNALARDSLSPVVQTMLLRDFTTTTLYPFHHVEYDRGRTLEEAWDQNFTAERRWSELSAPLYRWGKSPLATNIRSFRGDEEKCLRPSLIFSPMLVEDSRRLLISNLDLGGLAVPTAYGWDDKAVPGSYALDMPSIEFFRLYPNASEFKVGTAARMSATFAVVSPAIRLPARPSRRVVDAGYFDNYGMDVISHWLIQNKQSVVDRTSGVLVIQIRAYPLETDGLSFEHVKPDPFTTIISAVSAPVEALVTARGSAAYHRNNELLGVLNQAFNSEGRPKDYFATAVFELNGSAALSWYLPGSEKTDISKGFYENVNGQWKVNSRTQFQLDAISKWFGKGG